MFRICIFCASLIAILFVRPQITFSQDSVPVAGPAGPGYGDVAPTQAQIDAANKRFQRINAGLPPEEESQLASNAATAPNSASASNPVSNSNRPSATSNAGGTQRKSGGLSARAATPSGGKLSPSRNTTTRPDSSRKKSISLSSNGSISLHSSSQTQLADGGSLSSNSAKITWSEGFQELAAISGMSIDLKNLPSGKFDLARLKGLSPAEARDALNGMLLSEGLTVIESGKKLSVIKLSEINPADVPLVSLDELDKCLPNRFVRVEFPLRYVLADAIALELSPHKSEYGSVSQLSHSSVLNGARNSDLEDNEIRIVDSAQHVQHICKLIAKAEQVAETSAEERAFSVDLANNGNIRSQLRRLTELRQPASQSAASWSVASPKTFNMQIIEDQPTNSLLAIALPQQIEAMAAFLRLWEERQISRHISRMS